MPRVSSQSQPQQINLQEKLPCTPHISRVFMQDADASCVWTLQRGRKVSVEGQPPPAQRPPPSRQLLPPLRGQALAPRVFRARGAGGVPQSAAEQPLDAGGRAVGLLTPGRALAGSNAGGTSLATSL